MPRAEAGSTKAISNQMKQKGLTRLRWYCQVCEKACRDENAFKQHTLSESHVRQMQVVGANSHKVINDYSRQFQSDFVQLLRTSHGEKRVNINHFYNTYIQDRHHVHQNATKWHSLTDFAKHLGREGICRVDEEEPEESGGRGGIFIAWIDNSPEAMRRSDALRKKERQDRGDEEREQALIRAQIKRARLDKDAGAAAEGGGDEDAGDSDDEEAEKARELTRQEGEKIKLNFIPKPSSSTTTTTTPTATKPSSPPLDQPLPPTTTAPTAVPAPPPPSTPSLSLKPKNVFSSTTATAKKPNPLHAAKKPAPPIQQQKPMSQAEKIMKEELERKRLREERMGVKNNGGGGGKRQKVG